MVNTETNEQLAKTALDCLEELQHRGNRQIEDARRSVLFFYMDILQLKAEVSALEAIDEHYTNWGGW